ncbi:MAG: hypothetical protein CMJ42_18825 [Phyllobacteriaceae bacterium]|nr:hypothetical protein [Phyllobacteriaceae bacterium]MBA91987.1 hypothetical protein [Phyllobacteriaceae bacterium]
MLFTEENIDLIFGKDDAENEDEDRFRQYFFSNDAYERILSNTSFRILVGHKGVGKSAILKRAHLDKIDKSEVSIFLRPDDIISVIETAPRDVNFNSLIEHWKKGIVTVISNKIFSENSRSFLGKISNSGQFDFGGISDAISDFVNNNKNALGKAIKSSVVEHLAKGSRIHIFIDDIDRGWSASKIDILNISALINAIRDISGAQNRLFFRIGLRADVYYLVRTSDESTDKIEGNVVWLKWTNHEILSVIAKRVSTFFRLDYSQEYIVGMSQSDIDKNILSKVITEKFDVGRGHWSNRPIHNILLSLTRKRPRDLVKLLRSSALKAKKSNIISASNLEETFFSYSNERLQDVINEFRSELENVEDLLMSMRPLKKERKASTSFLFTNDELSKKITNALRQRTFVFRNGKPATSKAIHQFLYKIDFITARIEKNDHIERLHFDESRFLAHEIADFGYKWEIHPAYRWALEPQDVNDVIDSLRDDVRFSFN